MLHAAAVVQLLWFMYRGIFTVGVTVTRNNFTLAADFLTDYSYVYASDCPGSKGALLARCLTGLGPNGTSEGANGVLGGWYLDGTMIPNSGEQESCSSDIIQVRPGAYTAGVSNIRQCATFCTAVEGIYTCTMMNSSMMNQSFRFGVYLTGRSESFDLHISLLNHLSSLHSCSRNRSYITK